MTALIEQMPKAASASRRACPGGRPATSPAERSAASVDPRLADRWFIPAGGAFVSFSGRVSRFVPGISAQFTTVTGEIDLTDAVGRLAVDVDLRSLFTGNPVWDELLTSADPLRVREQPFSSYRGTVDGWQGRRGTAHGRLTLAGTTQPVPVTLTVLAVDADTVRVRAHGEIDRRAFGVTCNLPGLAMLLPRRLALDIAVTAYRG